MSTTPLAIGLSFTETRRVFAALAFAAQRHRDAPRPGADPCLAHPIAVAETIVSIGGVTDAVVLCAALLHDVINNTETPPQLLIDRFGREIADVVLDISDDMSLPEPQRRRVQIAYAPNLSGRARLVRLADMLCRLQSLAALPRAEREAETAFVAQMVGGLSGMNAALEAAADKALLALHDKP
jgi:guanosine-3',5'-bis(diphosphate) 3'-pyrophosphohydrolase